MKGEDVPPLGQWRLVALKVPEARTQCPTIIVFTTPVGFGEWDTHLWASILQNFYPFRKRSFPLWPLSERLFVLIENKIMSSPDLRPHVGAAHSIVGNLSSIAYGCNKLHSLHQSNSTDTTDQSSQTHRSQPLHTQVPKLTCRRPCTVHTQPHIIKARWRRVNSRGRRRRYQIRALRGEGAGRPEASVPGASVSGKLQHYLKIVAHP